MGENLELSLLHFLLQTLKGFEGAVSVLSCPTLQLSGQAHALGGAAFHETLLPLTEQSTAKHPDILRPLPVPTTRSDYTIVAQNMGILSIYNSTV